MNNIESNCKTVPCKPALDELKVSYEIMATKVPWKIFYALLGSLALFCMFVVGNSLSMNKNVEAIKTSVAVTTENVRHQTLNMQDLKDSLKAHSIRSDTRHAQHETGIRDLERSINGRVR